MQDQLQKAINLAKKTGDRLIVFDTAKPDNTFVVMALKDYENLILGKSEVRGLTEDELLDKINRDIAIWKSEQNEINFKPYHFEDSFDFNKLSKTNAADQFKQIKRDRRSPALWSIPSSRKQNAEEVIEEDRQYLEEFSY